MVNMKANRVVHQWCEKNDRWIYIEYDDNKIIGLNFMQGDEYEYFKEKWAHNDEALMAFYNAMLYTFPIEKSSCNPIEFINKVMWAFHEAGVIYDEFN
jgi:hypothetical protein